MILLSESELEGFLGFIFITSRSLYSGEDQADRAITISVIDDKSPLPPPGASEEEDAILLQDEAYIDGPIKVDYGTNLRYTLQPHPAFRRLSFFSG